MLLDEMSLLQFRQNVVRPNVVRPNVVRQTGTVPKKTLKPIYYNTSVRAFNAAIVGSAQGNGS
jgi:hypothetical protein